MRRALVEADEPRAQLLFDVGKGRDLANVIKSFFAQSSPEALHLASRRRIVGLGVQEGDADAEACADELQGCAAVGCSRSNAAPAMPRGAWRVAFPRRPSRTSEMPLQWPYWTNPSALKERPSERKCEQTSRLAFLDTPPSMAYGACG